jgi:hypothetical protein
LDTNHSSSSALIISKHPESTEEASEQAGPFTKQGVVIGSERNKSGWSLKVVMMIAVIAVDSSDHGGGGVPLIETVSFHCR